jgi:protein SCO1
MKSMFVALLLVLAAGFGALYHGTDGFQVVTTESARRLAIAHQARQLPAATLQFSSGQQKALAQALQADGRVTIVNFIYTRCNAICSVMGTEFQQLQRDLQRSGMDRRVRLLSLSFDPRDQPAELAAYARQMQAQAGIWQFAGIPEPRQRQALLDAFGITVIAAPLGEFQHNAAFHIVDADGLLVGIVDYDAPQAALDYALRAAQPAQARVLAEKVAQGSQAAEAGNRP